MVDVNTFSNSLPADLSAILGEGQAAERLNQRAVARDRYHVVLRRLDATHDTAAAAAIFRWIGRTYLGDGNYDAALDCAEAALGVAEATGDQAAAAHAVHLKAATQHQRGRLDEGEALYLLAREKARAARAGRLEAVVEHNLGVVANVRGEHGVALAHYRRALALSRRVGLPAGALLVNLGMLYADLRRFREAERAYDEALAACVADGDYGAQMEVEANRAELFAAQRRFGEAQHACERALRLSQVAGDHRATGAAHKQYGVVLRETGRLDEAEEQLRRAAEFARIREDLLLAADTERELAELYRRQERNQEMLRALNRSHQLFSKLRARRDVADVGRRLHELEGSFLRIVRRWGESIEAKDHYTKGHCDRVAEYAVALARAAGVVDERLLFWFRLGALLHDVGKLIVPSEVLNKPGPLTTAERELIERHPPAGVELLAGTDFPWDVRPMVRHHHERWDGLGYPDGLAGDAIPDAARVLCIADVYDALTSTRSYREAYPPLQALAIMRQEMVGAFDPALLATFARLVDEALARDDGVPVELSVTAGFPVPVLPPHAPATAEPEPAPGLHDEMPRAGADVAPRVARVRALRRVGDDRPVRIVVLGGRQGMPPMLLDGPVCAAAGLAQPVRVGRVAELVRRHDAERYDAALITFSPSRGRGFEAIRRLQEALPELPIVVVDPSSDPDVAVQALREGAQEYLPGEALTAAAVARAARCAAERHVMASELRGQSLVDDLTGLYNRRGFLALARQHEKLARRLRRRVLHIFLDLDGLKEINDTFGHREGDLAIIETADLLRQTFRESDVLARLGGDEFAVLAMELTRPLAAGGWRERLDAILEAADARRRRGYRLGLSVGTANFDPRHPVSLDELVAQADAAMYEAKRRKRQERGSQPVVSPPPPPAGADEVPQRPATRPRLPTPRAGSPVVR